MQTYFNKSLRAIGSYFVTLCVAFHDSTALFGFFIFLVVASQIVSGTMLAFSLVVESALIAIDREEEDAEVLYIDDFFWLHERGVDFIFIFGYMHLFRKLYLNSYDIDQEVSWKSGVFTFLIFQVVTFCGLLLCSTHLSEITLTIAANIFHTFFAFYGKAYWWVFTDKTLNTDTMVRMAYLHYVLAFYMAYAGLVHGIDLHYDWKSDISYDGLDSELAWFDEALANELSVFLETCVLFIFLCFFLYPEPESVSYELFMWGDIGLITDVRFYGVAPHWYFRPFMAWLIVCPHHKTGIFGLLLFFFALFHQPSLNGVTTSFNVVALKTNRLRKFSNIEIILFPQLMYLSFILSILYTSSFLPYGRFYNRVGGNNIMLLTYLYVLIFLNFHSLRQSNLFNPFTNYFTRKVFSVAIIV